MPAKVLVFDDDEDILSLCSIVLSDLGWEVHTQSNCHNMLDALENIKPSVILMDNCIKEFDGVVATQTIKAHNMFKQIPVIYFSGSHQIKALSIQAGADAYLEKPFDIKDLEKVLKQVVK